MTHVNNETECSSTRTVVKKTWDRYDPGVVKKFNLQVQEELGWLGRRWGFSLVQQAWSWEFEQPMIIAYWFNDPHDATLFALKYLGS